MAKRKERYYVLDIGWDGFVQAVSYLTPYEAKEMMRRLDSRNGRGLSGEILVKEVFPKRKVKAAQRARKGTHGS